MTMIDKYMDWVLQIKPAWAGFVVYAVSLISMVSIPFLTIVLLCNLFGAYLLLVVPLIVAYAFYLAIFKQGEQ